jgi:putative transposase
MILTKKIQIIPDAVAQKKLWEVSSRCTELANACIEQRRDRKSWGKVNIFSQKKELPLLKKVCPEFKIPSSQVLQNVVFSIDRSYKMFFTKRKQGDKEVRPPKYKSRRFFFTQEYSQKGSSFDLSASGTLKLAYGKSPREWIIVPISDLGFECAKTVSISRDEVTHKWYAN